MECLIQQPLTLIWCVSRGMAALLLLKGQLPSTEREWSHLPVSALVCPRGLLMGVPEMTTEEARPW